MRSISIAQCVFLVAASASASAADLKIVSVHMRQQSFVPEKLVAKSGSTISWTNDDTVPHSVTADDGRFDSGPLLPGQSFKWMAGSAGKVAYHCIYHPSMTATLTVREK